MSVLKSKRTESKMEFVNTANRIYTYTINFLSHLSARYSRILTQNVSSLASEIVSHAEKANSIYPSDGVRKEAREKHLLESRASLMALDVQLTLCYEIMIQNPAGCFQTSKGSNVNGAQAKEKLDKMAQTLGELIDFENTLLTKVLKSDKKR